jgi:hypothetical protein
LKEKGTRKRKNGLIFILASLTLIGGLHPGTGVETVLASPPFFTDDAEPIKFRHGEVFLAIQYFQDRKGRSASLPYLEFNYGVWPEVQFHLLTPVQYVKPDGGDSQYGYGDTEIGIKFRLIQETKTMPMVGTYPMVELPTGNSDRGLGNGQAQYFLPLWLQKSWGPWFTSGGGGYWINQGTGNKNWWFVGWQVLREVAKGVTLGGEVFHRTSSYEGGEDGTAVQLGAIIDLTDTHHVIFSIGRDLDGPNLLMFCLSYQFTFGPKGQKTSLFFKPNK